MVICLLGENVVTVKRNTEIVLVAAKCTEAGPGGRAV